MKKSRWGHRFLQFFRGINKLSRFTISPDVLSQEVGGETVLLDLKGEAYFGLNEVGTRVWQLLNLDCGLEDMLEVLGREFEVTGEQLREDVEELLGRLVEVGVINCSSGALNAIKCRTEKSR